MFRLIIIISLLVFLNACSAKEAPQKNQPLSLEEDEAILPINKSSTLEAVYLSDNATCKEEMVIRLNLSEGEKRLASGDKIKLLGTMSGIGPCAYLEVNKEIKKIRIGDKIGEYKTKQILSGAIVIENDKL